MPLVKVPNSVCTATVAFHRHDSFDSPFRTPIETCMRARQSHAVPMWVTCQGKMEVQKGVSKLSCAVSNSDLPSSDSVRGTLSWNPVMAFFVRFGNTDINKRHLPKIMGVGLALVLVVFPIVNVSG